MVPTPTMELDVTLVDVRLACAHTMVTRVTVGETVHCDECHTDERITDARSVTHPAAGRAAIAALLSLLAAVRETARGMAA